MTISTARPLMGHLIDIISPNISIAIQNVNYFYKNI